MKRQPKPPTPKQLESLKINEEFRLENPNGLDIKTLLSYDFIIVAFSGGKDSLATYLWLLDVGVPAEKIELWHHDIDGREGSDLMDWECTRAYCQRFAEAFGSPIYFSWRMNGFEGELMKKDSQAAPICWEEPTKDGIKIVTSESSRSSFSTRLKFPAKVADLRTRWCSSSVKIEVGNRALNNQERFKGKRTLFLTGERAQESTNRSYYRVFESHSCHCDGRVKRHVDHLRPVLDWKEEKVWKLIEKYRVNPHPAYKLGWGRVSCSTCIFGNPNQWASIMKLNPTKVQKLVDLEIQFDHTIDNKFSIVEMAEQGTAYEWDQIDGDSAMNRNYDEEIILPQGVEWKLPKGAFGDSCGPI